MTPISKAFAEYNRHINSITTLAPLTVYDHFKAGYEAAQRDKQSSISVETEERIKADAEAYVEPIKNVRQRYAQYIGYIAGATAENSRAQVLVDALEWIKTYGPVNNLTVKFIDKALEQWKGKEVEPPKPTISKCGMCGKEGVNQYLGNQFFLCDECFDGYEKGRDQAPY